jgi:hypothetical protein
MGSNNRESGKMLCHESLHKEREGSAFGDDPRMSQQNKGNNNGNNYWERKISDKNQARNCAGAFWRVELAFRETGLFQAPLKSTRGIHCS